MVILIDQPLFYFKNKKSTAAKAALATQSRAHEEFTEAG
jgi:hypothetical protein